MRMPLAAADGRIASMALSMTSCRCSGCTSRWIFPEMMRLMSSRSLTICACARTLRSIVSSPALIVAGLQFLLPLQQRGPALDRIERRAQLVRQGGEEFILHVARAAPLPRARRARTPGTARARSLAPLSSASRSRSFWNRRALSIAMAACDGDADDQPLGALGEHARLRMAEEQSADDLTRVRR